MSLIQTLSSQAWVERLGWTLVHFLWQGALIVLLYAAVRSLFLRRVEATVRYTFACAALAAMIVMPLITWTLMSPPDATAVPVNRTATIPHTDSSVAVTALPSSVRAIVSRRSPGPLLLWVVMAWLLGATLLWMRLLGGWMVAARMRSLHVRPAPPEWQQTIRRLAAQIGITRPVRLLVSALVQAPAVVGWLRPVVLVPVGALTGLPAAQLELLLIHELAHIRRHDYLVNVLQSAAEALLFYHPAVWWVSGRIRAEREACCDDLAVAIGGDVLAYARALTEMEAFRPSHLNIAVAANGGSLAERVARLLGSPRLVRHNGLGSGLLIGAVLLLAGYGLSAQSETKPAFEVASVKRNTSGVQRQMVRALPGGRLTTENSSVMMLIQNAYAVQLYQVVGGPDWIKTEGYDIDAKPEGQIDRQKVWPMLQTLLAERFHLSLHRETHELPVFVLTAAKGGIKVSQPPKDSVCPPMDAAAPAKAPGTPGALPCGMVRISISLVTAGIKMDGTRIPMAELVRTLAGIMGRPVIDKTGFTGEFEINAEFERDESTAGLPPRHSGPVSPDAPHPDSNVPSIFAAIQEHFGLKLESAKGPVEVLVVDRLERPTAN